MSAPTPILGTKSYQHRAYLAEDAVRFQLLVEGRLLGWDCHDDLVAFHKEFATWDDPAEIRPSDKRTVTSGYYASYMSEDALTKRQRQFVGNTFTSTLVRQHFIKFARRDHQVLGYSHEVAHSLIEMPFRADGHTPEWAATFIDLLGRIDPYAAKLLRKAFRDLGLTIGKSVAP